MKFFAVRLNPDLRGEIPYSKYPSIQEYEDIREHSSMNGFHEAVNFLPEGEFVYGYLPPRHSAALRDGEPFCLISITAVGEKAKGINDQIIGIQVGCRYTNAINRKNNLGNDLTYHYKCAGPLSLLLSSPIPNARKIILQFGDKWPRVPTIELSKRSSYNLIKVIENSITDENEIRKFCTMKDFIFDRNSNESNQQVNPIAFQNEIDRLYKENGAIKPIGNNNPRMQLTSSYAYVRDSAVVAYALKRANGKCEECGNDAPFIKASNGIPFLEVHHEIFLSQGGSDTTDNVKALCPNCHRKKHFG